MPQYDAEWYKSALNAMHDMVLIKGPQAQMLWANAAFLQFYGMTQDELRDLVDADHSDPDNTLQYVIDDQTVVDTGEHLNIPEEFGTDAQGVSCAFHTIKSPIFDEGRVVRTIGVSRGMTQKEIAQRDVDHKNAKAFVAPLKALTRSFPNPMMMVDVKARVIHTSALWDATFGEADITVNSYLSTLYPEFGELTRDVEACLRTKSSCKITLTVANRSTDFVAGSSEAGASVVGSETKSTAGSPAKDGAPSRIYAVQISPWFFSDGIMGGATVIATDVSALHARSKDLQNANEELVQYAYRASHDLKGPISTVKGLAGLILEDNEAGDTAEIRDNALKIIAMMDRLDNNVTSILDLARADLHEGDQGLVDLRALLTEICDGLSAYSSHAGVAIQNCLTVRHVQSDPVRLRQIMENLIANSIRYHAPNRRDKFVRVRSHATDMGFTLEIEDNGRGIPDEAGDQIFERFTRFHQDSEGSGLGLAIVKRNVDALHGEINVTSSSAGTAFRIDVPHMHPHGPQP